MRKVLMTSVAASVSLGVSGSFIEAKAVAVAPAIFTANGSEVAGSGGYRVTAGNGSFGNVVLTASPTPSVSAGATSTGPLTGVAGGGEIRYYFEVVGSVDEIVPLQITTTMSAGGSAESFIAEAGIGSNVPGLNVFVCSLYNSPGSSCAPYSPYFSGTIDFSAQSNNPNYDITLIAGVDVVVNGSAFAFVDPQITIDPSFPDAGLFTIVLSPGIGNSAPTPAIAEPSSLMIFASSFFGALGILRYRRRLLFPSCLAVTRD